MTMSNIIYRNDRRNDRMKAGRKEGSPDFLLWHCNLQIIGLKNTWNASVSQKKIGYNDSQISQICPRQFFSLILHPYLNLTKYTVRKWKSDVDEICFLWELYVFLCSVIVFILKSWTCHSFGKAWKKSFTEKRIEQNHYKKWRKKRSKFTYRSKSRAFIDSQVAIFILFFWIVIWGVPCNITFLTPEWGKVHKNES